MLYPRGHEPKLSTELFRNPTAEYRGAPFWSWNTRITDELVLTQAEMFRRMGFGGFFVHARTGLATVYLGDEFMRLVKLAASVARNTGMLCWLYDEDRFPSGAAGGLVTGDVSTRARYIRMSRENRDTYCPDRAAFDRKVAGGGKPGGYYLASYRVVLEKGRLASYDRVERAGNDGGKVWHVFVEIEPESPWYNNQTYLDVMNKKAVERFISLTHERYYQHLGDEFGKTVPGIFTDEPNFRGRWPPSRAEGDSDITLAYTDDFNDTYRAVYGYEILDKLPELVWELPEGRASVHRWRYHDHVCERFVSSYVDTIGHWCGPRGIAFTGHLLSERTLFQQTLRLGEAMRCYRGFQIPGIDILIDDREFTTAKQAASVSAQYGREGTISELYGVTQWDFDFKGHKLQGDWQAALGITIRCQHLSFMSMEGEAKRDWPASILYQSPWWECYPLIEDHFSRLNTVLTRGRPIRRVAVIHPIESFWLAFGPNDQTQEQRNQLDENFENLVRWLLYGLIDFDFISESLLPGLCPQAGAPLRVGQMSYQAVLVPGTRTLRSSTLERLEQFRESGGTLIFAGDVAELTDAEPSNRAARLAERSRRCSFSREAILKALEPFRDLSLRFGQTRSLFMGKPAPEGQPADNLFYQMREDGEGRWLFICHVNRRKFRTGAPECYQGRIRGLWDIDIYDTADGSIRRGESRAVDGGTFFTLNLYAEDSILLHLKPGRRPEPVCPEPGNPRALWTQGPMPEGVPVIIDKPDGFRLSEPNDLLLDYARYSLDGGPPGGRVELLRLDNAIRAELGWPERQSLAAQPWCTPEEPVQHRVRLIFEFDSDLDIAGCSLGIERPGGARITLNGEQAAAVPNPEHIMDGSWFVDAFIRRVPLPAVRKGGNRLEIDMPFGRNTNIEALHLLGNFGVDFTGAPHLTPFPAALGFGDVTRQGLPFYTGNIYYRGHFTMKRDGPLSIVVPHFSAPLLEVYVDGKTRGRVAFSPHQLRLEHIGAGEHTLEICCYGSRQNAFGSLHNANDDFKWYGPDAYRTRGDEWTESYRIRPVGILSRVELYGCQDSAGL
ncbi:MAG: hypothetical protein LBF95_01830 [Treponema sp.]|jgi:hypothetical protein|nr:hypothetical protein [Treponema sp.]